MKIRLVYSICITVTLPILIYCYSALWILGFTETSCKIATAWQIALFAIYQEVAISSSSFPPGISQQVVSQSLQNFISAVNFAVSYSHVSETCFVKLTVGTSFVAVFPNQEKIQTQSMP